MASIEQRPISLEPITEKDSFLVDQLMPVRQVLFDAETKRRPGKPMPIEAYRRIADQLTKARPAEETVFEKQTREEMLDVYRVIKEHAHSGTVNPDNMQNTLQEKVKAQQPIRFVTYWGGSDKHAPTDEDAKWWRRIQHKVQDVAKVHKYGVELNVIFADHHVKTNGFVNGENGDLLDETKSYWEGIGAMVAETQEGYETSSTAIRIQTHSLEALREEVGVREVPNETIEELFAKYRDDLVTNAANRAKKTETNPVDAVAKGYIKMRYEEKNVMKEKFGDAILTVPGVATGVDDIILAEGMSAVVLGGRTPWFQNEV